MRYFKYEKFKSFLIYKKKLVKEKKPAAKSSHSPQSSPKNNTIKLRPSTTPNNKMSFLLLNLIEQTAPLPAYLPQNMTECDIVGPSYEENKSLISWKVRENKK